MVGFSLSSATAAAPEGGEGDFGGAAVGFNLGSAAAFVAQSSPRESAERAARDMTIEQLFHALNPESLEFSPNLAAALNSISFAALNAALSARSSEFHVPTVLATALRTQVTQELDEDLAIAIANTMLQDARIQARIDTEIALGGVNAPAPAPPTVDLDNSPDAANPDGPGGSAPPGAAPPGAEEGLSTE